MRASDAQYPGIITLTNGSVVSHTVGVTVGVAFGQPSTATLNGVLWFGNGQNVGGAGAITVTHAITGFPLFGPDGYHIMSGSGAINAGLDTSVTTDVDGQPRPFEEPDLGADEYWPAGALSYVYLPLIVRAYP